MYGKPQPSFIWAERKDDNTLDVSHPSINKWKMELKQRYQGSSSGQNDFSMGKKQIHAFIRDFSLKGKHLEHALRVVSHPPYKGEFAYAAGINSSVWELSKNIKPDAKNDSLVGVWYGPVVVYAYTLNSEFEFKDMDDATLGDLRHAVDYFRNSGWNPTITDPARCLDESVPALVIADIVGIHQTGDGGYHSHLVSDFAAYLTLVQFI